MNKWFLSAIAAASLGLSSVTSAAVLDFEGIAPAATIAPAAGLTIDGFTIGFAAPGTGQGGFPSGGIYDVALSVPTGPTLPPFNGTDALITFSSNSITFSNAAGFTMTSIDASGTQATPAGPLTVSGVALGGGAVAGVPFAMDGLADGSGPLVDFQTFSFALSALEFTPLESVTFTFAGPFALDNFVFDLLPGPVPEPATLAFLGAGLAFIGWRRKRV